MSKPSSLFEGLNDQIESDHLLDDKKSQTPIPHSPGMNAPISAIRSFQDLLSPTDTKKNFRTCPNFFEDLNPAITSLDGSCEDNGAASNIKAVTSPGKYAPLQRKSDTKRRNSI